MLTGLLKYALSLTYQCLVSFAYVLFGNVIHYRFTQWSVGMVLLNLAGTFIQDSAFRISYLEVINSNY